jgi:hypothetical protein
LKGDEVRKGTKKGIREVKDRSKNVFSSEYQKAFASNNK